jgi:hypothetical protein
MLPAQYRISELWTVLKLRTNNTTVFERKFEGSLSIVTRFQVKNLGENLPPTRHQEILWETIMFMAYITCFDGHEIVCITGFEAKSYWI